MSDELRDSAGARLCAWCGGQVPPSRGTKPRAYCKEGCKQRAYEARKLERAREAVRAEEAEKRAPLLFNAYAKGRAEEKELRAAKSRDVGRTVETSRDVPMVPQVTPSGGAEPCPYCRAVVVGLVAHLRQCPEGPGTEGEPTAPPPSAPGVFESGTAPFDSGQAPVPPTASPPSREPRFLIDRPMGSRRLRGPGRVEGDPPK